MGSYIEPVNKKELKPTMTSRITMLKPFISYIVYTKRNKSLTPFL